MNKYKFFFKHALLMGKVNKTSLIFSSTTVSSVNPSMLSGELLQKQISHLRGFILLIIIKQ